MVQKRNRREGLEIENKRCREVRKIDGEEKETDEGRGEEPDLISLG